MHSDTHIILKVDCWLGFAFRFRFDVCVLFCHFVLVLFTFVVLDLVSSVRHAKRLARKNVSEIIYFVSSGT